jgi:hypothetical protein
MTQSPAQSQQTLEPALQGATGQCLQFRLEYFWLLRSRDPSCKLNHLSTRFKDAEQKYRSTLNTKANSFRLIAAYRRRTPTIETSIKDRHPKAQAFRMDNQITTLESSLVCKQPVMHLPKVALLTRALGSLGGPKGQLVDSLLG